MYVGLAEMKGYPAENPGDKWYHENIVYIRPDSLFLEGNPVVVHRNGDKGYSASDGGFYSYSGRIDTAGGGLTAQLRMFSHDYIGLPVLVKDTVAAKTLSLDELLKRGLAVLDSSMYNKTATIYLAAKGFEMDSVQYVRFKPDSLPNLPLMGFPDPIRFFKKRR
ncbi:hypothetical protein [Hymenobacter coccineus]|uniref:Uncharacterized protein n=1 Tax=Hymenobacter coccineus TaxID=1908235 RepID=A0A1G1SUB7_9BACT|nr:hypothetical protein [Hymenobacter coccineus]OGX82203.1 hypothetical protein BEN49_14360 [Hymenobacter coccineus]